MNCPQCNTLNTPQAAYCRNCGAQLTIFPVTEETNTSKTTNLFVIYLGIMAIQTVFYMLINGWLFGFMGGKGHYDSDFGRSLATIREGMGWLFTASEIVLLILISSNLKGKKAQTWLIIYTIVTCIAFVVWHVMPLVERFTHDF